MSQSHGSHRRSPVPDDVAAGVAVAPGAWPAGIDDHAVFRALVAASPDGLLLVDQAGRILLANPAAAVMLGYADDELIGLSVEALVPDSIRPRHAEFRDAYGEAPRARPMGTQMDLVAKRRDGTEVMVEIALSPLQAHGLPYVMASVRGVGDYPRVRQALQRARYSEHLAQLGRIAVDARDPQEVLRQVPLIATQALEVELGIVFLVEPGRQRLRVASGVGLIEGEGIGDTVANRPDTPPGFVFAQAQPVIFEDYRRETRFAVPPAYLEAGLVSGLSVPLSDRGRIVGTLAVRSRQSQRFGDPELRFLEAVATLLGTCLQRAQTEEALNHSLRLESVGQLTGGIAHDFNNLLTVIQGNLQVMADLPAVAGDGFAPQLVAAATRASRRGAELTGKLLAFSRRQVLQPATVDVGGLLQSLADMLRRTLDQRIRIRVVIPRDCPDVLADQGQLESALLNIAINARDAMPDGGDLVFSAEALDEWPSDLDGDPGAAPGDMASDRASNADADRRYVRITISDTGTGMPDEVKERAFEPFFTTKQSGRGTGLGLSTVYGFARQSRGAVELSSRLGAGTSLSLVLPQPPRGGAPALEDVASERLLPAGLRVLLVEDDPEVRAVARRFLLDLGGEVTACASGEEALRRLEEQLAPELLLSDVALGAGMRGTELAALVRERWPMVDILLMSGYSSDLVGEVEEVMPAPSTGPSTGPSTESTTGLGAAPPAGSGAAGTNWALLPKPYTRDQLAQAIARVLAR